MRREVSVCGSGRGQGIEEARLTSRVGASPTRSCGGSVRAGSVSSAAVAGVAQSWAGVDSLGGEAGMVRRYERRESRSWTRAGSLARSCWWRAVSGVAAADLLGADMTVAVFISYQQWLSPGGIGGLLFSLGLK